MKWYSPSGEEVHLALTSGHTAVIGAEPAEILDLFHREAAAAGCLPEGVKPETKGGAPAFNRRDVISTALQTMLDGGEEGDFKADGTPDLKRVQAKVGFKATREEVDSVWAELTKKD